MRNRILLQLALAYLLGVVRSVGGFPWVWIGGAIVLLFIYCRHKRQPSLSKSCASARSWKNVFSFIRPLLCILLFLFGAAAGKEQELRFLKMAEQIQEQEKLTLSGRIIKKEEKSEKVIYHLKHPKDKFLRNNILIYLDTDEHSIGTTLLITGTARPFQKAANEGNFDEESYYYGKNIAFSMRDPKVLSSDGKVDRFREGLHQLRKKLFTVFQRHLPPEEAGVLSVMALGEKDLLDPQIKKLYQQSGISHVLAISGLHISLVGAGLCKCLKKLWLGPLPACILSVFFVYSFATLSGMELSAQRAVAMFLILSGGNCLKKSYDSVTALSISLLIQLWENPFLIQHAGFLFSYSAVLAVVVCPPIWKAFVFEEEKRKVSVIRKKLFNSFKDLLIINVWISLATLPLTLYFFYEFPIYGILINVILLPFMGFVLFSGLLGGLLGLLHPLLGSLFLQPASYLLQFNRFVCSQFQTLPGAVYIGGRPDIRIMALYYGILIGTLCLMKLLSEREPRDGRNSRPMEGWQAKPDGVVLLPYCTRRKLTTYPLSLILVMALLAVIFYRPAPEFSIAFLDVGQGDGIHIASEEGQNFFIDGGSNSISRIGEYRILPYLKSKGIRSIDAWFVSHVDDDHVSGLQEVLELGYPVKSLVLSRYAVEDDAKQELIKLAENHGTRVHYLQPGQSAGSKSLRFTCLYPQGEGKDRNANSLVLMLEYSSSQENRMKESLSQGGFSAFFSGDLGVDQERHLARQGMVDSVRLYKSAHHGSKNSNSSEILSALSPVVTVVSCAERNPHGHPAKEAVERMEECGSSLFYTMKSGQITVGYEDGKIWVREFK